MKKVLVITYSQSGQLDDIVSNITDHFPKDIAVCHKKIKPIPPINFPWKGITFYDVMPESVRLIPSQNEQLSFNPEYDYDLIILGYPIWFLSPPIPLTTFLKSPEAKKVLNGKPVVTVIGSRNMWVTAQEDIKKMIIDNGGLLKGNIALSDRHNNLISVVTIVYWMTSGRKDKYLGIFPKPGISDDDIRNAKRFAPVVASAVISDSYNSLQNDLLLLKAVNLSPNVVSTEEKGKKIFNIWSGFILKRGGPGSLNRVSRLKLFKYYLLFVIFAVSPIVTVLFYLTWPLFIIKRRRKMKYYSGVELK